MSPWFKDPKYTIMKIKKKDIPEGLWVKCQKCVKSIYHKKLKDNMMVCPFCDYHFVLQADERIKMLVEENSFEEFDKGMVSIDPLAFEGPKTYKDKLKQDEEKTNMKTAVITGKGYIDKYQVFLAVTDSRFIMGSMGSVVGEKITRLIEAATEASSPVIIVSGSGGGARMYEGMFSLMQMAKTSAALKKHKDKGMFYVSVLTHPTMAGVLASFAGLGDVIIAEPGALVGFTGPRVIKQTIKRDLPEGFQSSQFMLDHGMIDMVVHRRELKTRLSLLLEYFK